MSEGSAPGPAAAGLARVRRASLRALARAYGDTEPSPRECDAVPWESGLLTAYRSLPGRSMGVARTASAEPPPSYHAPVAWTMTAAAAAFALMLVLAPPTAFWETRGHLPPVEIFGIPNASSGSLAVLLARVWTWLSAPLLPMDVALTLFALAATSALVISAFVLVHRVWWRVGRSALWAVPAVPITVLTSLWIPTAVGAPPAQLSAYQLGTAAFLAAAYLWLRSREQEDERGRRRYLLAAVCLALLGAVGPGS